MKAKMNISKASNCSYYFTVQNVVLVMNFYQIIKC